METTILTAEINTSDLHFIEVLLKKLKAKNIRFAKVQDNTKMTKEAYFSMIDEARKGEKIELSKEEIKELLYH